MMNRRKLPIDVQTFREAREDDCYYVDKTPFMRRLAAEGKHYLLSRPRRFGKSLFLDTLKELFEGNEALFEGLHIHPHWDWTVRRPVVRLDFDAGHFTEPGRLEAYLMEQLDAAEGRLGLGAEHRTTSERFALLLEALHEHAGQRVVVLVDAYDKPILDAMNALEVARANRSHLRGLYAFIVSNDAHVEFTFLTGVSNISRVSLFPGLDDLEDITLDSRYSTICGFTEVELETAFAPELPGLDRDAMREWYNGYRWLGDEKVYNPFDILQLFQNQKFNSWWFEIGTPSLLVEMLFRRHVASVSLEGMLGSHDLLSAFDVEHVGTEALLFQAGYLTIKAQQDLGGGTLYRLGYPNREVRQGLNEYMLRFLVKDETHQIANQVQLYRLLEANDIAGLEKLFRAFFARIPHEWHTSLEVAGYEGYHASVFYSYFAALGLPITVEDDASHGRLDMAVVFDGNVYLFEFKVVELAGEDAAIARLHSHGYADKYRSLHHSVHLIGVEFSKQTRKVVAFEALQLEP